MPKTVFTIRKRDFDAVIFDLDGVITQTARVHAAAWKQLFDDYREERLRQRKPSYGPFDIERDYREYVDGKPRYDGIQSFLEARGIEVPYGAPDDPPDRETICGLGNRKNRLFQEALERIGVKAYDSSVRLVRELRAMGMKVAVISASKNCSAVLRAADLQSLFDAQVDGVEAGRLDLKGKPAPDVFVEAARRLGAERGRSMVVEDAVAGVQAGRRGGFGLVIGIDRTGHPDRLKKHGADIVVSDLVEINVERRAGPSENSTADLPSAIACVEHILGERQRPLAVFLDYDGTLTPIVSRPEDAFLSDEMRSVVSRLAGRYPVAVISGRGLEDVRARVALETITYAGSHGFEIKGPGLQKENEEAQACKPELDQAEKELKDKLKTVPGSQIERKNYSIAVHFRNVAEDFVPVVGQVVEHVSQDHPRLRRSQGKKVYELQPGIDWHKGKAVAWLLDALQLNRPEVLPVYIGDDLTDEDAFRTLREHGVGIVVRDEARPTAAHYALENPQEVGEFLRLLAEA